MVIINFQLKLDNKTAKKMEKYEEEIREREGPLPEALASLITDCLNEYYEDRPDIWFPAVGVVNKAPSRAKLR